MWIRSSGRRLSPESAPARGRDAGFTLIELLVTILILALLAAIAVPYFMRQREKGWVAQLQAGLRNAATAETTVLVVAGAYTADEATLRLDGGWRAASDVSLTSGTTVGSESYCLEATHALLRGDHPWKIAHFSSELGTFGIGPCPGAGGGDGDGQEGDDDDDDDDDSDGD